MSWLDGTQIAANVLGVDGFVVAIWRWNAEAKKEKATQDKEAREKAAHREMLSVHLRLVRSYVSGQPYSVATPDGIEEQEFYQAMVKAGLLKPSGTGGFQPVL
jgi:hypothetical protein